MKFNDAGVGGKTFVGRGCGRRAQYTRDLAHRKAYSSVTAICYEFLVITDVFGNSGQSQGVIGCRRITTWV
jgi:hypothetical protein